MLEIRCFPNSIFQNIEFIFMGNVKELNHVGILEYNKVTLSFENSLNKTLKDFY